MGKIKYFEALRGISIIMVIGIHTKILDSSLDLLIRQFLNCAVPIFFALSGFFLYRKMLDTREKCISFWRRQIPKVYIPVLIWSLPKYIPMLLHGNIIKANVLLFSCGHSIYYFVAVIIQFYLLLPLLHKLKVGSPMVAISSCISIISIIIITYVNVILGISLPLIIRAGFCILWLWFFVIGCRLSQSNRHYSLWVPLFISAFGIFSSFFEGSFLLKYYGGGVGIKPTSFIFSAGMCYLLLSSRMEKLYDNVNSKIAAVIEYLGKNSFILYLLHIHVVKYAHRILDITHSWTANFFVVLIISILMIEIIKKLVPSRFHYYLGIYK